MELIIGAMVFSAMLMVAPRMIADAAAITRAAGAGEWGMIAADRERRSAARERWWDLFEQTRQRRHEKAMARAGQPAGKPAPGMTAYAKDIYAGWWEDAINRRAVKRAARPDFVYDPDRPPWWQRVDDAVRGYADRLAEKAGGQPADTNAPADDDLAAPAADDGVCENQNGDQADGSDPTTPAEPDPHYDFDGEVLEEQPATSPEQQPKPSPEQQQPTTTGGTEMTDMTLTQAIADHEALLKVLQEQLDSFLAIRGSLGNVGTGVDVADNGRHVVATKAAGINEALAAMTKDGASLAGTMDTATAMSASNISMVQEHIEAASAENDRWIDSTQEQIANVQASLAGLSKFNDAADMVAATGTRGEFLNAA